MDSSKPSFDVILSPQAEVELWEIWQSNAERYSASWADQYNAFLKAGILALSDSGVEARQVRLFPALRFVTLKRRSRGNGHFVIFECDEENQRVHVLHIYHTKMDVIGRLYRNLG